MPGGCGIFAGSGKRYQLFPQKKKLGQDEIECNDAETIVKYCSRKFHISRLLHPREGLGTAKDVCGPEMM